MDYYQKYLEICILAIKNNIIADDPKISSEQYIKICIQAVKHNVSILKYVKPYKMTNEQYLEICKIAVLDNKYLGLYYVPEHKRTFEICKLAVEHNGLSLKYVPIDEMTRTNDIYAITGLDYRSNRAPRITEEQYYEICILAVKQNGYALQFIPKNKKTYEICLIAINNNSYALQYVQLACRLTLESQYETVQTCNGSPMYSENITDEIYYILCKKAVNNNGKALRYVLTNRMTNEQYLGICKLAVKNNGFALKYVKANKIEPEQYYEICKLALQHSVYISNSNEEIYKTSLLAVQIDGTLLYYVNELKSKITDDQYFEICKKAITSSYWNAFDIVIADNMTPEQYYEICKLAVTKYGTVLQYVIANKMTIEQYYKICKLAVKTNGIALQYVITDNININMNMTDYQKKKICKLALQNLENLSNSNEDIYETCLVAVQIDGNLLYDINKLISNLTYEQYNNICKKAIKNNKNREVSNYIVSEQDYNNLLYDVNKSGDQSGNQSGDQSGDQSGGKSGANNNYSYNYDEFFKLMKKESENLEMFNLYKMILNKIINEYNKNNKIDEFEAILYGALATGQDPSKVPILFEILKISILDKDKQTILLSYNKKKRIKMLNKYSNKDVLTQIEQKIKYFYDLYKKEVAYIQQRILKLDSKYRKKLLKFDNPEKIKYIIKNVSDNKIKELFDKSNLNNLYSLNLYDLMDYLDKYIKKSSRIKKSCFVKVKKSSKK
jgi:hypothetical protein